MRGRARKPDTLRARGLVDVRGLASRWRVLTRAPRRLAIWLAITVGVAGCDGSVSFRIDDAMRNNADASYSPERLTRALDTIEQWHRSNGTRIASELAPGLDDAEIDRQFADLGCVPSRELRALWRWRNGHEDTGVAQWLGVYHQFLPLEAALEQRNQLRLFTLFGWDKRWIPVFQFQDEWYFVECGDRERDAGPLLLYFIESGTSYSYLSLTSYLETMAQAMSEGAIRAQGPDRDMIDDTAALAKIHARLNPGLSFPYHVP